MANPSRESLAHGEPNVHGRTAAPARFLPHEGKVEPSPLRGPYARLARPLLGALLVGILIPPVTAICLVIAVAQLIAQRRLSEVFFVQWRAGRGGKPFRILKFRTLKLSGSDEGLSGDLVPTALGALLRKSHLDELPQLWNVVRGEMSLIGPRPETLELEAWADARIPGFTDRLVIRPGITGLAQVVQDSIPAQLDAYREKLRLNQAYLESMGLLTDIWILARTALRPLRPRVYRPETGSNGPEDPASGPRAQGTPKELPVGSR